MNVLRRGLATEEEAVLFLAWVWDSRRGEDLLVWRWSEPAVCVEGRERREETGAEALHDDVHGGRGGRVGAERRLPVLVGSGMERRREPRRERGTETRDSREREVEVGEEERGRGGRGTEMTNGEKMGKDAPTRRPTY